MSDDKRPPPTSTIQAAGHAASDIIGGLKGNPGLLTLVLLNVGGIVGGLWFLSQIADASNARWQVLMNACLPRIEQSFLTIDGIG